MYVGDMGGRVGLERGYTCPISLHFNRCIYSSIKSVLNYLPWSNIDILEMPQIEPEFLNLSTIDIYGWVIIC